MRLRTLYEADQFVTPPRYDGRGVREVTFDYSGHKVDPHPKILYLGQGKNPHSGNDIVGGINLNYLRSHPRLAGMENVIKRNIEKLYGKSFDELMSGLNSDLLPRARALQLLFQKNGVSQHLRDVYRTYSPNKMNNLFYGEHLTPLNPEEYDDAQKADQRDDEKNKEYAKDVGDKAIKRAESDEAADIDPEDIGEPEEKIVKRRKEERDEEEQDEEEQEISGGEVGGASDEEMGLSSPRRRRKKQEISGGEVGGASDEEMGID